MPVPRELVLMLRCPKCKAAVRYDESAERIVCTGKSCGLRYPVTNGIPVMLVDRAERS